jgi:hypothetical protein
MQQKSVSIRLMNPYSRGAEPQYRPTFFQGEGAGRLMQQGELITGHKVMKEFLERDIPQIPTKASALLQKLDSEGAQKSLMSPCSRCCEPGSKVSGSACDAAQDDNVSLTGGKEVRAGAEDQHDSWHPMRVRESER